MSSVSLVSEPIDRCSKIHVMIRRMIGYEKKFLVSRVLVGEVAGVNCVQNRGLNNVSGISHDNNILFCLFYPKVVFFAFGALPMGFTHLNFVVKVVKSSDTHEGIGTFCGLWFQIEFCFDKSKKTRSTAEKQVALNIFIT